MQDTHDTPPNQPEQATQEGQDLPVENPQEAALLAAQAKISELQDAFLRAKAEAENVRRRAQEDITKASKFASFYLPIGCCNKKTRRSVFFMF